ncbi:MAG TPA: FAD-dependent oxidoreductase [Hyphomicrobiaceae bacterium]|nr:FAD-dependent oxidoreductase [Hyphomicrobiaceae bacterium]
MAQAAKKIVICGAGIAGVAAAYYLAVEYGHADVVLVEAADPLSLTSDKSTEGYRNWWPGPDQAMTAFMNRSIDLIEAIARATGNRIAMNRRGYLFATAEPSTVARLEQLARTAEQLGTGPVRVHADRSSYYRPPAATGFEAAPTGADIITEPTLIRRHFPQLAPATVAVLHARRAGWLSAQQLGMVMLEGARAKGGVKLLRATVVGVSLAGGRVNAVEIEQGSERQSLPADAFVIAAGPMQKEIAALIGVDLPVFAERHLKISFQDRLGAVPRGSPMLIWLDRQHLPWSEEERAVLAAEPETRWLLQEFAAGVHARPEGGGERGTLLLLFNYEAGATQVVFPLPEAPHYAEIALRGAARMVPALAAYFGAGVRPFIDGGYYVKTRENRPLIGPLPVEGAYITGAFSGFGVMAACAAGDLLARHISAAALPNYAPAFLLERYGEPAYQARLAGWGDGGQL